MPKQEGANFPNASHPTLLSSLFGKVIVGWKCQVDKMSSQQNVQSTKCWVDKMSSRWNVKSTKWWVDEMSSQENVELMKCRVNKMSSRGNGEAPNSWGNFQVTDVKNESERNCLLVYRRASIFTVVIYSSNNVGNIDTARFWCQISATFLSK